MICEFPLRDMLAFHRKTGAEGTILVTQVRKDLHCAPLSWQKQLLRNRQTLCMPQHAHRVQPPAAEQRHVSGPPWVLPGEVAGALGGF